MDNPPKIENLPSFTHPHVVSNLYYFIAFLEHKRNILQNVRNQTFLLTIDFRCVDKKYNVIQWEAKLSSFVLPRRKKAIQVWNDTRMSI